MMKSQQRAGGRAQLSLKQSQVAASRTVLVSRGSIAARASVAVTPAVTPAATPLPLIFVSAECSPWSKTGGLGDVVGGLPIELVKRGHKVISIAPRYDQYEDAWDTSVSVEIDGETIRYFHTFVKGVHRVWVDHPLFLAKVWGKTGAKLYGPQSGADFIDNHKRFTLFNKAAIEASRLLPFGFGEEALFVANDWHASLVPLLLKDYYQPRGEFLKSKVALVIHNIAFQGRMWPAAFPAMHLPQASFARLDFTDKSPKVFTEDEPMEENEVPKYEGSHKKLNWLKAGILTADQLLTVSPQYALEIAADVTGGVELNEFIKQRGGAIGIVNGMDVEEWDPRVDKFLSVHYNKTNVYEGKQASKAALQADTGLPIDPAAPLFSFIGRLEEQKGVDIMLKAIPKILAKAPDAQIVILGTGKAKFEKALKELDKEYKGQVAGIVKFSAPLAHLITAGADFILVPSRFEPCGLIQLHAMQYGTVPIVSSTGGLVDTVKEGVTGFHIGALEKDTYDPADEDALALACERAAQAFSTPLYKEMVLNCISQDLSWSGPAKKWEGVLEQMFYGMSSGTEKAASVKVPVAESNWTVPASQKVAATDKPLSAASKKALATATAAVKASANGASAAPSTPSTATKVPATVRPTAPAAATAASPVARTISTATIRRSAAAAPTPEAPVVPTPAPAPAASPATLSPKISLTSKGASKTV